ncbi:MAG: DUF4339 domain-containing protein [Parachlamydiales bacterium]|nr:DUF4339 domain-containing protein [Parachlamydiales bacterium]
MNLFLTIILLSLGFISAHIAQKRGKNPYFWFMIGFLFGLLGMVFLLFSKKSKVFDEKPLPPETSLLASLPKVLWYYLDSQNKTLGPMSLQKLQEEWNLGKINPNTYVWTEDLETWKQLKDIANLTN